MIFMYKKHEFGKQLAEQVIKKYEATYLANWAHRIYLDHANQLDDETRDAIMTVIAMDEGDEFVLTKEELLKLAADLQKDA
jgi:hypothetical protein